MKTHINLVKFALSQNYSVSLFDEEGLLLKKTDNYKKIIAAINSVDCVVNLLVREKQKGLPIVCTFSILIDNDNDTVSDYVVNEFSNNWEKQLPN